MIQTKDLLAFINNNDYWYGDAKNKLGTYLTPVDKKELKLGFYTDLTMGNKYNSLYELSTCKEYTTDIIELQGSELSVTRNESIINEQNDFFFGVYEIITNNGKMYFGELYDSKNKYNRCDYLYSKVSLSKYLDSIFNSDQKYFPPDLIVCI